MKDSRQNTSTVLTHLSCVKGGPTGRGRVCVTDTIKNKNNRINIKSQIYSNL